MNSRSSIYKNVVVFGGAFAHEQYLHLSYSVGKMLAEHGFATITGGGTGMMEQVNKGAYEAGGQSQGICIQFDGEEAPGNYFTYKKTYTTFDERHHALLSLGDAFVVLPGGLGTILEALTITQKKKFGEVPLQTPLIFVGRFFSNLDTFFQTIAEDGFIQEDLKLLYQFVTTPDEMISVLFTK
jgi:hypothetical protein